MRKNAIEIEVQISQTQQYNLALTSQNYKQQFKLFIRQHNIDSSLAFYLKNIVQSKIITLYKGYKDTNELNPLSLSQINNFSHEKIPQGSPKFGNYEQKQTQTIHSQSIADEPYFKTVKKTSQSQSLFSTNIPSYAIPFNALKQEQILPTYQKRQEDQFNQVGFTSIFHQQSEPNIATLHKPQKQIKKQYNKTTKKMFLEHSPSQQFSRLYQTPTQSFKNKHNKDIDHKQYKDYQEVQKYIMNQQLKRTTQDFFKRLHHQQTESFTAKRSKSKQLQQKQPIYQSPKKIGNPLSKTFKGSQWQSGRRCQLKIMQAEQLQRKSISKQKQQFIRNRMIKEQMKKKPTQQNTHKSRSCQKCNPIQKKTSKHKQKRKMPEPKKQIPRPYISNILAQSYNEYKKQFSLF